MTDGLAKDGLTDCYHGYAMGCAADLTAAEQKISRKEQDAFAIESYTRSQNAWNNGKFKDEVVSVDIPSRKGEAIKFEKDEEPWNVKFDKIPGLKPAFGKEGTVTAANASTMNDGAAALVLMSKEKANELGIKPIAKIVSYADAEQAYTTASRLRPTAINPLVGLLNTAQAEKDTHKTERAAELVLHVEPSNYRAQMALAGVHFAAKDYHRSASEYRRALSYYPEDVDAMSGVGWSAFYNRENREALENFRRILTINPNYTYAQRGFDLLTSKAVAAPTLQPSTGLQPGRGL